jgi:hypothetical protein
MVLKGPEHRRGKKMADTGCRAQSATAYQLVRPGSTKAGLSLRRGWRLIRGGNHLRQAMGGARYGAGAQIER